jgi:hypothetical protein
MGNQLKCEVDAVRMSMKTPDEVVLVCLGWEGAHYVILESAYTGEYQFVVSRYLNGERLAD